MKIIDWWQWIVVAAIAIAAIWLVFGRRRNRGCSDNSGICKDDNDCDTDRCIGCPLSDKCKE